MDKIRVHSTVCAHLCRLIASRKGLSSEIAFLCGLLHDIGMAATLLVLSERPKEEPAVSSSVLDEVLRQTHQEVSGMIAQLWKLPADVQTVLAHHHTFPSNDSPHPLSAVMAITEELSLALGKGVQIGAGRCDQVWPEVLGRAKDLLKISDDEEAELLEAGRQIVASVTQRSSEEEKKPAERKTSPRTVSAATSDSIHARDKSAAKVQARLSFWQRLRRLWSR